ETSCSCSGVQACLFQSTQEQEEYLKDKSSAKLKWIPIDVDKELRKSITIPARAIGVLRISWNGPKTEPEQIRLKTKVWNRAGQGQDYSSRDLVVLVNYVRAVRFDREKVELGSVPPKEARTAELICWSATRAIEVAPASDDKCLQLDCVPL